MNDLTSQTDLPNIMNQSYMVHLQICSICRSQVKRTLNIGGFIGVHGGLIITACALTRQAVVLMCLTLVWRVMITLSPSPPPSLHPFLSVSYRPYQ